MELAWGWHRVIFLSIAGKMAVKAVGKGEVLGTGK
jgi:hypothetical protein